MGVDATSAEMARQLLEPHIAWAILCLLLALAAAITALVLGASGNPK